MGITVTNGLGAREPFASAREPPPVSALTPCEGRFLAFALASSRVETGVGPVSPKGLDSRGVREPNFSA